MKKNFVFALFIFCFCRSIFSQAKDDSLFAEITLEADTINYGVIEYGSDGYRIMKFRNTGNIPLVIQSIKTNGGGNISRSPNPNENGWPVNPIPPGGERIIYLLYDTKRVGPFFKNFYITSNAAKHPTKEFHIKGKVLPPK